MKTKNDILIKVLSLGIGLAVGIVLIAKVFFEPSYDSFYKDIDRPILAGDPVKVLSKWGSVMVSRSFAEKMGGVQECIGKQIANADMDGLKLTIEGVFEDFPKNGSLDYDILLSMDTYGKQSTDNWLGNDRYKGYVKLFSGVDPNSLTDAIRKMQEAHQPLAQIEAQGTSLRYFLKPFSTLHTSDPEVKSQVILLSIVAALLILISLLNYILIVISSMVKRSKEVGVRKCYGAEGRHIYGMLSKEALLHIVLSLAIASVIIFAGRGIVENLLGVPFQTLLVPQSIMAIAAVLLFVLVISIVVPAELYQRIPVYAALKNYTENSRNWKLGLLGFQVLINVFLVVMMLIIGRQYQKVSNADTGYDYKNLYYFDMFDGDRQALVRAAETLRGLPEVTGVAASYNLPFQGSNGDNVYLPDDDRSLFNIADQYECSGDFYDLMGIQFVEGRAPRDSSEIVVDEKFVTKMAEFTDWSDGAVGKLVFITGHDRSGDTGRRYFTISGIYKPYLIGNLTGVDNRPSALFYGEIGSMTSWMPHTLFKVRPDALEKVRGALNEALPDKEINIVSYAEEMRAAYDDSKKMRNTMAIGSVFSLLIALLGLIGFIKDESLRRSKEMAVRKINGATTRDILSVFAKDIMKLSIAAALIACIGAFFVARRWLEQFAEKVSLNPLYFICGALLVLAIVLGMVVLNCLRIARANPVDSLKNE